MHRNIQILCIANFIGAFGEGLYAYVLPNIIRNLEATPTQVGITYAILHLAAVITPIPGGLLADKYDRKKLIILGWLIWLPIPILFSLATHWTHMLPSMFLYGFWLSGPATSAYIATTTKPQQMATAYTAISASYWLGYTFSPSIGAHIAEITSIKTVFYLTSLSYAITIITLTLLTSQHATDKQPISAEKHNRKYSMKTILAWTLILATLVYTLFLTRPTTPQLLEDHYKYTAPQIGLIGSTTFAGATIWCILLGKLGDKWRKSGALSIGLIASTIATTILITTNNYTILLLNALLMGASYTLWSLIGSIVGPLTPPIKRARWISITHTGATTAALASSLTGGILYEAAPYTPFLIFIPTAATLATIGLISKIKE
jgi:MFS family permease